MSTFLLIVLGRFFGGFGFWWSDELSTRFTAAAETPRVSGAGAVVVVYARSSSAQEEQEPKAHEHFWTDDDDQISNGF